MTNEAPTREEIEKAVEEGVKRAFLSIGISNDPSDALEHQKDMAYLRQLRIGSSALKHRSILFVIGGILTFIGTLVVVGLQALLGRTPF